MKINLFLIILPFLQVEAVRNYGYLFNKKGGFIQAMYTLLCNESAIKLELFINRNIGVLFYAENKIQDSSVLVYFKRPGIYMNVKSGKLNFTVPFTLDFFNNEWNGWHEVEIRISKNRLGLSFDGILREAALNERFLFPENDIENNVIYFGREFHDKQIYIQGFLGFMRNILFMSCGCDRWQSVKIIDFRDISFDHLGDCKSQVACQKGCSCLLFPWGSKKCDCSGQQCALADHELFYGFDKMSNKSPDNRQQLQIISTSDNIQYDSGLFGESFRINDNNQWVLLSTHNSKTCFKNIFFCPKGIMYQYWLLLFLADNSENEFGILKHASSIQSIYGVEITQIGNQLKFLYITDSNKRFQLFATVPMMQWHRISMYFNETHLNVYLNLNLINSTKTFTLVNESKPIIINTKYLIIGDKRMNSNFKIDEFKFSTNFDILYEPSIQELKMEHHPKTKETNNNCVVKSDNNFKNLTQCFSNQFQQSNFSLGLYISVIFSTEIQPKLQVIMMSSLFNLSYISENLLKISFINSTTRIIRLRETMNDLCFLEISITSESQLSIFQSADYHLDTMTLHLNSQIGYMKPFYLYTNSNEGFLKEIHVINVDKNIARRALRLTNKLIHYSMDFDHLDYNIYLPIELTNGYFGNGVRLSHPQNSISLDNLKGSCITNVQTCYDGFTLVFRMKMETSLRNSLNGFRTVFNSGKNGVSLLLDNMDNFLLLLSGKSVGKFISKNLNLNKWYLVELSLSPTGVSSLFLNDAESQFMTHSNLRHVIHCSGICFGDSQHTNNSFVFIVDEINIWDAHRWYLYANGFISKKNSRYTLYSFTNYQLGKDLLLNGSAKLISTKYGQGVSLNGFGPRFASIIPSNFSNFYTVLDECHRGISIFMWLRIDNLAINRQIFLSSPQFTVGANLGSLFVRLSSLDKVWYFSSKDILQVLFWQFLIITWRPDNGLKVFLNKEYIGHVISGNDESHEYSHFTSLMYFGKENTENSKDYSTIILDDVLIFDSDLANLAYNIREFTNISCLLRHSFDERNNSRTRMQLGVIGNAGNFLRNLSTDRSIFIPKCFLEPGIGCRYCFTLRFWMYAIDLNVEILRTNSMKLFISANHFQVNIFDRSYSINRLFVCKYIDNDVERNWIFIEISWDTDEGLLLFLNRELLICNDFDNRIINFNFSKSIKISDSFNGFIDELELYKSRLSILYWNEIIDENKIDALLQKLNYKLKLQKEMTKMARSSRQGKSNFTIKYIQSFEFNGSNYLEYKMPISNETAVLGGKEEIEVSFKILDNVINSVIWISDGKDSKAILALKNSNLYFTKIYLIPSSNGSKRVSEELEIYQNIKPDIVYNLLFHQKSGKFVIKITSIYETTTQSVIGRDNLLPINSNIYFGGYKLSHVSGSNSTNSSFVGQIYKARIKSLFNKEAVDIIQEMAEAKSNPNVLNHGNVKVVMKSIETVLPAKASFLNTIIDRKMSLMISNPFISVILPKWDFELLVSFELEFSTYESHGLLIFLGNSSHFIAVELFDSQIYFVYKLDKIWNRVGIDDQKHTVNDNHFHNVYLGRDLLGHIKVFIDKKETLTNIFIPHEFYNSITIIGFYGSLESIPKELLSKFGFIGCIHFFGVNDMGFLNFSKWHPFLNKPQESYGLIQQISETFLIDSCLSPVKSSCHSSPCNGGWCQLTSVSFSGQSFDNYKCNCLYSSKSIKNNFVASSAIENYNLWIRRNMLDARSESCTADSPQILIIDGNYFKLELKIPYPFSSVMNLEFMILVKSQNCCVAKISQLHGRDSVVVIVNQGVLSVLINENLIPFSNININDSQWHGVQLKMRLGIIQFKIDNFEKAVNSSMFRSGNFSTITIGRCSMFDYSHFQIKSFQYNHLNIFQNMKFFQGSEIPNMFYTTEYRYPKYSTTLRNMNQYKSNPVTFLNNFHDAIMNSSIILSWINKIDIEMIVQYPGLFLHLKNSVKSVSIVLCSKSHLVIIYKNGYLNSERLDIPIVNDTLKFKLVFDLIKSVIEFENGLSSETYQITKNLYSWNVGDELTIEFGVNFNSYKSILAEKRNYLHDKCLMEMANKSAIGCLQYFIISNNKEIIDVNNQWELLMQVSPISSVFLGQCLGVERCHQNFCLNGKCRPANFTHIFCDCSSTRFTGNRCHLPKVQCTSNSCKNDGKCILGKSSREIEPFTCQCNGTGFMGKYCEISICDQVECLNNGICNVVNNSAKCNCLNTGFTGQYCENNLCDSYSCNEHGYCKIHKIEKVPMCDCNVGYFGDHCKTLGSSKCQSNCSNGGICTKYSPAIKLCSKSYCRSNNRFTCNCDHTIYRGISCEEHEFGFNPNEDGVIQFEGLVKRNYNYLRLLFEPFEMFSEMSLLQVELDEDYHFSLYMERNNLWLRCYSKQMGKEMKSFIGPVKPINILLITENNLKFNYFFNSKLGNILPKPLNLVRRRRNYKLQQSKNQTKLTLGCIFTGKNIFHGIIAGFQWNGKYLTDKNYTLWKNGSLIPLEFLRFRAFPSQSLLLILPDTRKLSPILWSIILTILLFSCAFYIGRRRFRYIQYRNSQTKDFIPLIVKNQNESEGNSGFIPSNQDTPVQKASERLLNYNCDNKFNRVIIFLDFDEVRKHRIADILLLPEKSHFVAIINEPSKSKNSKQVFPVKNEDYEYSCHCICASSGGRFVYSHTKRSDSSFDDDLMQLQVWEIQNDWMRICQPPNVKFTFSLSIPMKPSELLLFNRHSHTILIWHLELSSIIWQSTLTPEAGLTFNSLAISKNCKHIFVNYGIRFFIIDIDNNCLVFQICIFDFANSSQPEQIFPFLNSDFLIRNSNKEIIIFDTLHRLFRMIPKTFQVRFVTKSEYNGEIQWAFQLGTKELCLTRDFENNSYQILHPTYQAKMKCLKFSSDSSMICAGFEGNLYQVWKIKPEISVCRFHLIRGPKFLKDLFFTGDNQFVITVNYAGSIDDQEECVLNRFTGYQL